MRPPDSGDTRPKCALFRRFPYIGGAPRNNLALPPMMCLDTESWVSRDSLCDLIEPARRVFFAESTTLHRIYDPPRWTIALGPTCPRWWPGLLAIPGAPDRSTVGPRRMISGAASLSSIFAHFWRAR